jgi:[acyl-carrier-protein] S-malonyltransferase
MADSAETFRPALEAIEFRDPVIPIYSNVTGKCILSGAEAKKLALMQITSPVRWIEEEAAIAAAGTEACLEVGPGKVLQGLWRDAGIEIPCYSAGTVEDILQIGNNA